MNVFASTSLDETIAVFVPRGDRPERESNDLAPVSGVRPLRRAKRRHLLCPDGA